MSTEDRTTDERLDHYRTLLIDAVNMVLGDAVDRHAATDRVYGFLIARLRAKMAEDGLDARERLLLRLLEMMRDKVTAEADELLEKLRDRLDDDDEPDQTVSSEVGDEG